MIRRSYRAELPPTAPPGRYRYQLHDAAADVRGSDLVFAAKVVGGISLVLAIFGLLILAAPSCAPSSPLDTLTTPEPLQ